MKKSTTELRKFGLIMAAAFAVIGGLFLWRHVSAWPYLFGVGGFFLICGIIVPRILAPIEWLWMKLAHAMGIVMTYILLTLTYYIVITPVGLLMRIFGNDPMKRKFDTNNDSYWVKVDPDGPTGRPEKPY
jgi:hypothetical protein